MARRVLRAYGFLPIRQVSPSENLIEIFKPGTLYYYSDSPTGDVSTWDVYFHVNGHDEHDNIHRTIRLFDTRECRDKTGSNDRVWVDSMTRKYLWIMRDTRRCIFSDG